MESVALSGRRALRPRQHGSDRGSPTMPAYARLMASQSPATGRHESRRWRARVARRSRACSQPSAPRGQVTAAAFISSLIEAGTGRRGSPRRCTPSPPMSTSRRSPEPRRARAPRRRRALSPRSRSRRITWRAGCMATSSARTAGPLFEAPDSLAHAVLELPGARPSQASTSISTPTISRCSAVARPVTPGDRSARLIQPLCQADFQPLCRLIRAAFTTATRALRRPFASPNSSVVRSL